LKDETFLDLVSWKIQRILAWLQYKHTVANICCTFQDLNSMNFSVKYNFDDKFYVSQHCGAK